MDIAGPSASSALGVDQGEAESQFTGDKQACRPFRMTMTFRRRSPRHDERNANSNLVRASSRSYMYQHTHVCWYADIPTFPSAVSVNDFGHPAVCVQPWHCRHTRRTMVLQCRGSTFLAARQRRPSSGRPSALVHRGPNERASSISWPPRGRHHAHARGPKPVKLRRRGSPPRGRLLWRDRPPHA